MNSLSIKLAAALSITALSIINFALKANAQIFTPETIKTFQFCNTIKNMQDANLDNLELRDGLIMLIVA